MMNAIVARGLGDFHLEEVPIPEVGNGDILVKVGAAGVCAADRMIFKGNAPWKTLPFPFIPGHEFIGTIVDIGKEAKKQTGLEIGDKAIAELGIPCRNCYYCHRGMYHLCDNLKAIGGTLNGGWAEYLLYPSGSIVHRVNKTVADEIAVFTEPLANAIHGIELANLGFQDILVIAGGGAIGMGMLQIALYKHPQKIILLDVQEEIRKTALAIGADYSMDPRDNTTVQELVNSLTNGRGCDVFIEASGAPSSIQFGLELCRKAGRLVVFGVYSKNSEIDANFISEYKELQILGGHLAPNTYERAIEFLTNNEVRTDLIITHKYPLRKFHEALTVESKENNPRIKVILDPQSNL